MLGAGLAWKDDKFLRAVAIGVDVCDQFEAFNCQAAQAHVGNLNAGRLFWRQHDARRAHHFQGTLPDFAYFFGFHGGKSPNLALEEERHCPAFALNDTMRKYR
jgi:hypothetical protein